MRQRLHGITNYDSLTKVFDTYNFSYYRDNRLLATFAFSPVVGLRLSAGWRLHRRNLLQWNEVAAANGMARTLTGFAPRLSVSWTPALYHYRDGNGHAVPLHSKWPTFMVDYERGLSTFNASTSYERIETDVQYTLPLYALRALYFRGGCGFSRAVGPTASLITTISATTISLATGTTNSLASFSFSMPDGTMSRAITCASPLPTRAP